MDDSSILSRIGDLVREEHEILNREGAGSAESHDHERLRDLQETLDQCWDLLRQRRALRDQGNDADLARPRSTDTVERYQQ